MPDPNPSHLRHLADLFRLIPPTNPTLDRPYVTWIPLIADVETLPEKYRRPREWNRVSAEGRFLHLPKMKIGMAT